MIIKKHISNLYLGLGLVLLAVISRFIPHPPNFTPIMAMSVFAGILFSDKRLAFLIPLISMLITDLILGLHSTIPFVYLSFAIGVSLGFFAKKDLKMSRLLVISLAGSIQFYLITNFGSWLTSGLYPLNFEGLIQAYFFGLPFFSHTPMDMFALSAFADILFNSLFFAMVVFADKLIPSEVKQ